MSKTRVDNHAPQGRILTVTVVFALALAALSARILTVQVVEHDQWAERARSERMFDEVLPASRGRIYDRHGEVLVGNREVRNLVADRNHLLDIHVCRKAVARAEGLRMTQVAERFDDDVVRARYLDIAVEVLSEFITAEEAGSVRAIADGSSGLVEAVVSRKLPFDRAEQVRRALAEKGVRGFSFEDASERIYSNPGRLAQVLGFTNAAGTGMGGLEKELDEHMRGEAGHRKLERTRRSSELLSEHTEETPARNGADVVLTIDMWLQCVVERHMEALVEKHSPEKVMAVFMDPATGDILAMASRPHFDQATREGTRRIQPVTDRYEPGSVFKIFTLAAGFDQDLIELDTMFYCYGGYYEDGPIRLRDHSNFDYLTTSGILAQSSNIGANFIARQVGADKMHGYIKDFGFGTRTGIALSGEVGGLVARPGSQWWSKTSLSRIAMGYEVDATALQVVNAVAAIANGGNLMKPQIIRSVTSPEGESIYRSTPQKIRRVASQEAARKTAEAMVSVVRDGTGKKAAVDGFLVAGKTGTAWKPKEDRSDGYHKGRYVVSFAGFLPADNPRLVGLIVVDDPQRSSVGGSIYGGSVAAPMFAAIAAEAMPHLGVEPTVVEEPLPLTEPVFVEHEQRGAEPRVVKRRAARRLPTTVAVPAEEYLD